MKEIIESDEYTSQKLQPLGFNSASITLIDPSMKSPRLSIIVKTKQEELSMFLRKLFHEEAAELDPSKMAVQRQRKGKWQKGKKKEINRQFNVEGQGNSYHDSNMENNMTFASDPEDSDSSDSCSNAKEEVNENSSIYVSSLCSAEFSDEDDVSLKSKAKKKKNRMGQAARRK
jgi:hypothetical protein